MVASTQVEIPYYRGIGGQRGRGFGALADVIGRTATPEIAEVVSCRKVSRTWQRKWEGKF